MMEGLFKFCFGAEIAGFSGVVVAKGQCSESGGGQLARGRYTGIKRGCTGVHPYPK